MRLTIWNVHVSLRHRYCLINMKSLFMIALIWLSSSCMNRDGKINYSFLITTYTPCLKQNSDWKNIPWAKPTFSDGFISQWCRAKRMEIIQCTVFEKSQIQIFRLKSTYPCHLHPPPTPFTSPTAILSFWNISKDTYKCLTSWYARSV